MTESQTAPAVTHVRPKVIEPIARIRYCAEGEGETVKFVYLEVGSMIDLTKTLKWAYHKGIRINIEYIPSA